MCEVANPYKYVVKIINSNVIVIMGLVHASVCTF